MWNQIWTWIYENYIFHTFIVVLVICIYVYPNGLKQLFKRFKRIKAKAGPIELEMDDDRYIDPNTPCPYTKSRDVTFSSIRDSERKFENTLRDIEKKFDNAFKAMDDKIEKLKLEISEVVVITKKTANHVKNNSIDNHKRFFCDKSQPEEERAAEGLKYLYEGGNGHLKQEIIEFMEEHRAIYNALIKAKPEWCLKLKRRKKDK